MGIPLSAQQNVYITGLYAPRPDLNGATVMVTYRAVILNGDDSGDIHHEVCGDLATCVSFLMRYERAEIEEKHEQPFNKELWREESRREVDGVETYLEWQQK